MEVKLIKDDCNIRIQSPCCLLEVYGFYGLILKLMCFISCLSTI